MLEAVVLGVAGVLVPHAVLQRARIEAARACLQARGIQAETFAQAAPRAAPAPTPGCGLALALRHSDMHLPAEVELEIVLAARRAVPGLAGARSDLGVLRRLRTRFRLAVLEDGEPDWLQAWIGTLGLPDLEICLATGQFGQQGRPPRPCAFRWLARRLQLSPSACLYVSGSDGMRRAADAAGWRLWEARPEPAWTGRIDLLQLADRLESQDEEGAA